MTSGIKTYPYTIPQGEFPRMIISPVKVSPADASFKPGSIVDMESVAQWDTGADFCMISPELARTLHLKNCGNASVNVVGGDNIQRRTYKVNLFLPNGIYFDEVIAVEDPGLKSSGVDFLIGLVVINQLDFALTGDGRGNTVLSISYPAGHLVDFSKK